MCEESSASVEGLEVISFQAAVSIKAERKDSEIEFDLCRVLVVIFCSA